MTILDISYQQPQNFAMVAKACVFAPCSRSPYRDECLLHEYAFIAQ